MESLVRWCLKNKSVVILATVLLIGSGAYATARLNQELLPDISFPIITISTPVVGAGPDVVDEQVTQPVESAISGVAEIEAVQSISSQGSSVVVVEFDLDADTEEAEADLQSALDGIELLSQAGEPEVRSQSASEFPILTLSLAAKNQDLVELTEYTEDKVVPSVEEVEGVASVDLIGGAEKRVEVELNPDKLKYKGLSTDAVVGAVSGAKVDVPVGSVPFDGLETPVRATSEVGDAEALEDLPVGVAGGATDAPSGVTAAPSQGTAAVGPPEPLPLRPRLGRRPLLPGRLLLRLVFLRVPEALRRPARRSRCFWGTWGKCARSAPTSQGSRGLEASLGLNVVKEDQRQHRRGGGRGREGAPRRARRDRGGPGRGRRQLGERRRGVGERSYQGSACRGCPGHTGDLCLLALPACHLGYGRLSADFGLGCSLGRRS